MTFDIRCQTRDFLARFVVLLCLALAVAGFTAKSQAQSPSPSPVRIDTPIGGTTVQQGTPFNFTASADAGFEVIRWEQNASVFSTVEDPGATAFSAAGGYKIDLYGCLSADCTIALYDSISVNVTLTPASLTPTSGLDFGDVAVGASSTFLIATLNEPGVIDGLPTFTSSDPQFAPGSMLCNSGPDTCTRRVTFTPTAAGAVSATLTATYISTGGGCMTSPCTLSIPLTGTGVVVPPTANVGPNGEFSGINEFDGSGLDGFSFFLTTPAVSDLVINYSVSGSATSGVDYSALSGSAAIAQGFSFVHVALVPFDDTDVEPDETVTVTVQPGVGYLVSATPSTTISIIDDDIFPTAQLGITVMTTAEGNPSVPAEFEVSLTAAQTSDTTIDYSIGGTAVNGVDYETVSTSTVIPAGQTAVAVPVTPIPDADAGEGTETVVLQLLAGTGYEISAPAPLTIEIIDGAAVLPEVSISASDPNAAEPGTDTGTFTVTRTGDDLSLDIPVSFNVTGSAVSGTDYTSLGISTTIPAGSASMDIVVTVIDDSEIEGSETVIVTLVEDTAYYTLGSPGSATVTIADDDSPLVSITGYELPAEDESAGTGSLIGFSFSLEAAASTDVVVNFSLGGTAVNGVDYDTLPTSVTISAGSFGTLLLITPIDDAEVEGDETVIATLSASSSYSVGTPGTNTATIIDDDSPPAVSVTAPDAIASEPGTDIGTFTVSRGINTGGDLLVFYTIGGTATAGVDYTAFSGTVTIPDTLSSIDLLVTALDDVEIESPETVVLTISASAAYSLGTASSATVTVNDDDAVTSGPVISVTAPDNTATEAGPTSGSFRISSSLTDGVIHIITYNVSGSATAGSDYAALNGIAVIGAGSSFVDIAVNAIDDLLVEDTETVVITIATSGGGDGAPSYTVGTPSSATVSIVSDDAAATPTPTPTPVPLPTVTVSATDNQASEVGGDTATYRFSRSGSTAAGLTVGYTVSGTATASDDYTALPGSVVIPAGASSVNLEVSAIDDDLIEDDETVGLRLNASSTYNRGTTGTVSIAIISEDALPEISISASDENAAENGDNPGEFTLTRSGVLDQAVTVNLSFAGSATSGEDYDSISTSITIAAGDTSVQIAVLPVLDFEQEGDETVIASLVNSAAYIAQEPSSATVTIADAQGVPPGSTLVPADDDQLARMNEGLELIVTLRDPEGVPIPDVPVSWSLEQIASTPGSAGVFSQSNKALQKTSSVSPKALGDPGDASLNAISSDTDETGISSITMDTGSVPAVYRVTASTLTIDGVASTSLVVRVGVIAELVDPNSPEGAAARLIDSSCPALAEFDGELSADQIVLLTLCEELIQAANDPGRTAEVVTALRQISPEEVATMSRMGQDFALRQISNIGSRLGSLRGGKREELDVSGFNLNIKGQVLPGGALAGLIPNGGGAGDEEGGLIGRWGFFLNGNLGMGERDQTLREAGFDFDTLGLTAGADYRVNNDLFVGAAIGLGRTDVDVDSDGGTLEADGLSLSLYSNYYFNEAFYMDGIVSFGKNSYDMKRNIRYRLTGFDPVDLTASSDTDGKQIALSLGGGFDKTLESGLSLGLTGRFDYIRADIDGYTERGATGLNLTIRDQEYTSLTLNLGGSVSKPLSMKWGILVPSLSAEMVHEFKDEPIEVSYRFAGAVTDTTESFNLDTPDSDYYRIGAGLNAVFPEGRAAFLRYETTLGRDDYSDYRITAGIRFEF